MTPRFRALCSQAELTRFSTLLQTVAAGLEAEGRTLWRADELTPEKLMRNGLEACFLGFWQGEPVVGLILQDSDPDFWPDDPPGEALYLHKLAVHPEWQGRGLAHAALEFARNLALALGKRSLKLDTASDRPKLRDLYERYGFTALGERTVGRHEVTLYRLELP